MLFLIAGVVGAVAVGVGAAAVAKEAGWLGTPYKPQGPTPPRVGYS